MKDDESLRDHFGPEDFEDEHDARERRHTDRDNLRKAELQRIALKRYERNFDIRVSDDARSAAMCRHCLEIITGARRHPALLGQRISHHICLGQETFPQQRNESMVYEEAFS